SLLGSCLFLFVSDVSALQISQGIVLLLLSIDSTWQQIAYSQNWIKTPYGVILNNFAYFQSIKIPKSNNLPCHLPFLPPSPTSSTKVPLPHCRSPLPPLKFADIKADNCYIQCNGSRAVSSSGKYHKKAWRRSRCWTIWSLVFPSS